MPNERFAARPAPQGVESDAASAAVLKIAEKAKDAPKKPECDAVKVRGSAEKRFRPASRIVDARQGQAREGEDGVGFRRSGADRAGSGREAKIICRPRQGGGARITEPRQSMVEKLWGKHDPSGGLLAYASADASITASIAPKEQNFDARRRAAL